MWWSRLDSPVTRSSSWNAWTFTGPTAQTRLSSANWSVTNRHPLTLARQTEFVEMGPVALLRADAGEHLLPFPADLRYGWGLDVHWAQQLSDAARHGRLDGVAVVHVSR